MNITATGINWATNTFSRPGWLFRKEVFILLSAQGIELSIGTWAIVHSANNSSWAEYRAIN